MPRTALALLLLLLAAHGARGEVVFDSDAVGITTAASGARAVRAADLDADGNTTWSPPRTSTTGSPGTRTAAARSRMERAHRRGHADGASDVAVGDLDGRRRSRICCLRVRERRCESPGPKPARDARPWQPERPPMRAGSRGVAGARADVDGDGDLDAASARPGLGDGAIAWLENLDGTRGPLGHAPDHAPRPPAIAVAAVDMDGDGDVRRGRSPRSSRRAHPLVREQRGASWAPGGSRAGRRPLQGAQRSPRRTSTATATSTW